MGKSGFASREYGAGGSSKDSGGGGRKGDYYHKGKSDYLSGEYRPPAVGEDDRRNEYHKGQEDAWKDN